MMVWKIQPELHMFGKLRCFEVTQVKALMMKLRVLNVDGFVLRILHHQKHVMWKKQGGDMGTEMGHSIRQKTISITAKIQRYCSESTAEYTALRVILNVQNLHH